MAYLIAGGAYLLLRDGVAGRSVGKFFCSLVVVNLETGRPCGQIGLSGGTRCSCYLEQTWSPHSSKRAQSCGTLKASDSGDRLALTQVVEGFGARDVVSSAQEWWLDFLAQLDGNPRGVVVCRQSQGSA